MVEVWIPYGQVEVSFDIRQENLSQILEPPSKKLTREDVDLKSLDSAGSDSILILSGSAATVQVLDSLLSKNRQISKIIHTKQTGALARRKAQEFQVAKVEELDAGNLVEVGSVDSSPAKIFDQVKSSSNLTLLTSVHLDPLFGLTGAASDLVSLSKDLKSEAFHRSLSELPCGLGKSNASWFATRLLQTCPNVSVVEVVERTAVGPLGVFTGEPEATHAKVLDFWNANLSISIPSKAERIVFGSGGDPNDRTLTDALSRSFFNVVQNAAMVEGSRVCMLAECSQGLGSEALLRYVTGRFTPGAKLDDVPYFEGLEVLLSFYKVQEALELSMVSTLPKFYGEKFQFKMYSGAREAPSSVVPAGSRAKTVVIPDGSSSAFTLAGSVSS